MASKFEKRMIQAAKEAVAFARGELAPGSYRVHAAHDDDGDAVKRAGRRGAPKFAHRAHSGEVMYAARKAKAAPAAKRSHKAAAKKR